MLSRTTALWKASWSFPLLALAFLSAACSDDGAGAAALNVEVTMRVK